MPDSSPGEGHVDNQQTDSQNLVSALKIILSTRYLKYRYRFNDISLLRRPGMPDGGPGEGHVDHQQAEEGGTVARREQCLLLLFNLRNFFKKPRRKKKRLRRR
jgi:hypothetical protein